MELSGKNKIWSLVSLMLPLLPQFRCIIQTQKLWNSILNVIHASWSYWIAQAHYTVVNAWNTNSHHEAGGARLPLSCQALAGWTPCTVSMSSPKLDQTPGYCRHKESTSEPVGDSIIIQPWFIQKSSAGLLETAGLTCSTAVDAPPCECVRSSMANRKPLL